MALNPDYHVMVVESLVGFRCKCGFRWQNEKLKGKSDDDLMIERGQEFERHVKDLEAQGYA